MLNPNINQYSIDRVGKINDSHEFLYELVCLSHIGIKKDVKTAEFHDYSIRLLNFILETGNASLALLLTRTFVEIQTHAKFFLTANATNVKQLCDLILLQFNELEVDIYYNVMWLLNNYDESKSEVYKSIDESIGEANIKSILPTKIDEMDGNLYECYNLSLSIELLHCYLIIDYSSLNHLYLDLLSDRERFNGELSDVNFSKLLWYGFLLDHETLLKDVLRNYDELVKSQLWTIRFYRFIEQNLSKKEKRDVDKINRVIERFKKEKIFSSTEKKFIVEKITTLMVTKKKQTPQKLKNSNITKSVVRLSPYNLPPNLPISDIKHKVMIDLAVYDNEKMKKMIKTIRVEVLTDSNKTAMYVSKNSLKEINKEALPGCVWVEHYTQHTKNLTKNRIVNPEVAVHSKGVLRDSSALFNWPTTEVTGKGFSAEIESNGLNEQSILRKMGYQITDTTREKRWEALIRAVPKLGLKRVAYTIAGFVRMRKGQKNGRVKFKHAIAEWEYDLQRLKSKYYKKDFNWPRT
ncbi:hypothetical protein [Sporosarcina sp. ITBMC105]